jgi:hypothetical protein
MSLNDIKLSCAPLYTPNKSNQVMGYLCSSKNVENFKVSKPGSGPIMLYDNTVTYKEGDVVMRDKKLYFANDGAGSPGYAPGASGIWTSMEYNNDQFYKLNDRVSYNGVVYKVKDQATNDGAKGYEPSTRANIWMPIS